MTTTDPTGAAIVPSYELGWTKYSPYSAGPIYHCCLQCGYRPIEGMMNYRRIHGFVTAKCCLCGADLFELEMVELRKYGEGVE